MTRAYDPLALRLAGWPDDEPVWTASCPCPPFSVAGKKKGCPKCSTSGELVPCPRRAGYFLCSRCGHYWLADGRHLWPEVWRLVRDCRPPIIFGEQVASADGRVWLAGVRASLEILGYAVGAADLCAAGVGAPHIRQRLWWLAQSASEQVGYAGQPRQNTDADGGVAYAECDTAGAGRATDESAESIGAQVPGAHAELRRCRDAGGVADAKVGGRRQVRALGRGGDQGEREDARPGPLHDGEDFWSNFDLIPCADEKARRVEPGTFPLAYGVPSRVGRLRAYGNAIVPQVAAEFIKAVMEGQS